MTANFPRGGNTPRFYIADPPPATGGLFTLPPELHRHVLALRLRVQDTLYLFDGLGTQWPGHLVQLEKRSSQVQLMPAQQPADTASPLSLTLVQALPSLEKMDWIVQKAVELGVAAIVPVHAQYSGSRLNPDRAEKKRAHWQAIAIAACEQSGRQRVPPVSPVLDWASWLQHSTGVRWLLAPQATGFQALSAPHNATASVLVGPEGGWSPSELAAAQTAGCATVGLGPRILRTETAGLAMLAAAQARWGDW